MEKTNKLLNKEQDYEMSEELGGGAYGTVYKAKHKKTGAEVAIKKMTIEADTDNESFKHSLKLVSREIEILHKISTLKNNDFTVKLLDIFVNSDAGDEFDNLKTVFMVFDKYDFSMKDLLDDKTQKFDEEQLVIIIFNLLQCIKYIHSAGVIHRDLKPNNILLTDKCHVILCDFGLARTKLVDPKKENYKSRPMSPMCYTRYYRPPEVIFQNTKYNERSDIWSLGCIISELILKHIKSCKLGDLKRKHRVLFKGKSCHPLSPAENVEDEDNKLTISCDDQMVKIMEVVGETQTLPKTFFEQKDMHVYFKAI
jgi:serine/threonine protein kinase